MAVLTPPPIPSGRKINTTAPIMGGGDLSADRTLSMAKSTASVDGYLAAADFSIFTSKVSASRLINTSSPITGGANLSADLTIAINNAAADGSTKGASTFTTADFNDNGSGLISIDYSNGQKATTSQPGFLTSADWNTFNGKQAALGFTPAPNTRNINTTSPLTGGANLTADLTIAINNAAADGSTKGAAAFTASDFNDNGSGLISIDYTNGQKATTSQPGFLSSTDWTAFNNGVGDDYIKLLQGLGSAVLYQAVDFKINQVTGSLAFVDNTVIFEAVYIPISVTITGVKWWQTVAGSFTADNYNGVGLYSVNSGTGVLTLVASSTNDATIWNGAANAMHNKAFSSQYAAVAGVYFIAVMYNESAHVTIPAVGVGAGLQNANIVNADFPNSIKLTGTVGAINALPSPTQASSGISASSQRYWLALY